ncbi:virion structural protein [Pseudomonas phage D6]|nr:virion structural protein [Pseudomonas phage D6]
MSLDLERIRLQNKLRTLGEMLVSLEEYRQLAVGGLSKQAAVAVTQDVMRITRHIGEDTVALESHADLRNAMSQALSMEDSSSIGSRISAAIARFKEWLKKVYEMVRDQVGALLTSFSKLREKVEVLKGSVKSVPETNTEVHIPAKLAQQVSIQGDFGDGNFTQLRALANFGAVAYPDAINDFYMELASVVKSFDPSHDATSMVKAVQESMAPLNFTNIDNQTYPGNVMIVPDESGYNYSIAEVEARVVDQEVVRKVRSSAELAAVLNQISTVIGVAEKLEEVSARIETSINKVVEATDELEAKAKDGDEEKQKNANTMISTVLQNTSKVDNNNSSIIRYLGRVLEAHLKIIEHEVKTATNSQRA